MRDISLEFLAANLMDNTGVRGLVLMDKKSQATATMLDEAYQTMNLNDFRNQNTAVEGVFREAAKAPEDIYLHFSNGGLYLRQNAHCSIAVLTNESINLPSLRIATRLMLRQVRPESLMELRKLADHSDAARSAPARTFDQAPARPVTRPPIPGRAVSQPTTNTKQSQPSKSVDSAKKKKTNAKRPAESDGIWG